MGKKTFKSFQELNAELNRKARKEKKELEIRNQEEKKQLQNRKRRIEENKRRFEIGKRAREEQAKSREEHEKEIRRIEAIERDRKKERDKKRRTDELMAFVKERNIGSLMHFTRIENLDSILKHGLVSVSKLEQKGIGYISNDSGRFDYQLNHISLSIEYPNYWVLKEFRRVAPKAKWAIVVCIPDLIYDHECYFAEYNAATRGISDNLANRASIEAFKNMYSESIIVEMASGERKSFNRSRLENLKYLPTTDQAEILVRGRIENNYIREVIFMDSSSYKMFKSKLDAMGKKCSVDKSLFTTKRSNSHLFKRG